MILALLLTLATAFPSTSATAWMDPAAFRIRIGMSEQATRERFIASGIDLRNGERAGELVGDYEDGKTITVHFSGGKLESMRFELVDFLPLMSTHWEAVSERLRSQLGEPTAAPAGSDVLIWQESNPNVIAALSKRRDDRFGEKGLGFVVVRYFAPPPADARTGAAVEAGER